MLELTITNFFLYFTLAWGTNICLNFLYVIKRYSPKTLSFDRPIDFGLVYKGERLIGESTTMVGLFVVIILSLLLYFITSGFVWSIIPLSLIHI